MESRKILKSHKNLIEIYCVAFVQFFLLHNSESTYIRQDNFVFFFSSQRGERAAEEFFNQSSLKLPWTIKQFSSLGFLLRCRFIHDHVLWLYVHIESINESTGFEHCDDIFQNIHKHKPVPREEKCIWFQELTEIFIFSGSALDKGTKCLKILFFLLQNLSRTHIATFISNATSQRIFLKDNYEFLYLEMLLMRLDSKSSPKKQNEKNIQWWNYCFLRFRISNFYDPFDIVNREPTFLIYSFKVSEKWKKFHFATHFNDINPTLLLSNYGNARRSRRSLLHVRF